MPICRALLTKKRESNRLVRPGGVIARAKKRKPDKSSGAADRMLSQFSLGSFAESGITPRNNPVSS